MSFFLITFEIFVNEQRVFEDEKLKISSHHISCYYWLRIMFGLPHMKKDVSANEKIAGKCIFPGSLEF